MASREIELAQPLLSEVVEWVESDVFFQISAQQPDFKPFKFADGEIPIHVVDLKSWFTDVDIANDESNYANLMELINDVRGAKSLIHQFGPEEFEDFIEKQFEIVSKNVISNEAIEDLAKTLARHASSPDADWEEALEHLRTTVSAHFSGIINMRAASLSTRHAPTEALFYAYQLGLLPFGWDWEKLDCLSPSEISI